MEEPFVLPETAAVLAGIAEQGGPHLADLSAADMRAVYLQMGALFDVQPEAGVRWKDIAGPTCTLRAYFPGEANGISVNISQISGEADLAWSMAHFL